MRRVGCSSAAVLTVVAVLSLAACNEAAGLADTTSPSPSSASARAKQRVENAVLPGDRLPAKWERAPVQEHFANPGLPEYCGVTALPEKVSAGSVDLYRRTSTGPFILQYTSVGRSEDAAVSTMKKLEKVAATCRSDKNGKARYQVEPVTDIDDIGDEAVGFHYTEESGFTSWVVVFRRGDMMITVVDIGPPAVPYATVRSVASAVDDRIA